MPDYSKGKVYKIVCNNTGEQYFGSTIQPLSTRLGEHKRKKLCSSKLIIERGNYEIILCELFACSSREELLMCERKWIESNDCVNKTSPIKTREEQLAYKINYNKTHSEQVKQYYKEYNIANVDKKRQYQKDYYEKNKQRILERQKLQIYKKKHLL
jgi:hypothetical protein